MLLDSRVSEGRIARVREAMSREMVDAVVIPISGDLEWLIGHSAIPLERLTALVVRREEAVLVVPDLEFPGVHQMPNIFTSVRWGDGDDPYKMIWKMFGEDYNGTIAVGGRMWSQHLIALQHLMDQATWRTTLDIIPPLRRRKDQAEIAALRAVAEVVDEVIFDIQGNIPFEGRTERDVAEDIARRMIKYGHDKVDFVLVSYGPNAAIPHHMPDDTVIGEGILLFDIGGTKNGYHSDTTRCVYIGDPTKNQQILDAYGVLLDAQEAAVQAVKPGVPAEQIDKVARDIIEAAYPGKFIHRTGHGIGMDEHEHPFIAVGNSLPLEVGNTFSVEPGIYMEGQWGMRLEDIVLVTDEEGCNGHERLNRTPRNLVILNG